ncbi:MAG: hypothetical protein ACETVW_01950, partial [Dehalococcoidia bacterium]
MIHKKRLLIVLACLALVISVLSCAPQPGGERLELQLEKAPRLNEPVELTCIRTESRDIPNEKINVQIEWIEPKRDRVVKVPPEDVLVEGDFNWEAAVTKDVPVEFSAVIKFPYEGKWRIRAVSTSPGWESDGISLYVTEDSGTFDLPKDYRPNTGPSPSTPTERWPLSVQVDIPKAPRLDEPVELTWVVNSIRDIGEVEAEIEFYRMEGTDRVEVLAQDVLVEGDLSWEGSLKKDTLVQLSATIKLPQEGDWEIHARADCYAEL